MGAEELRTSPEFCMKAAQTNGAALQYMLPKFKADKEICTAAVSSDTNALLYAHSARRCDMKLGMPWDSQETHYKEKADQLLEEKVVPAQIPMHVELPDLAVARHQLSKSIQFSALSSLMANMGQGNYIASNMILDKFPFYQRPRFEATTIMWGAVGHIGMRFKAFATADFLNATPEILLTIEDTCKVLHMTMVRYDLPEWYTGALNMSPDMCAPTAGGGTGGGWKPGEDAGVVASPGPELKPRRQAQKQEEKEKVAAVSEPTPETDNIPLGGWASFQAKAAAPTSSTMEHQVLEVPLNEGAHVQLAGLKTKSGKTGVLLQLFDDGKDGKWKVKLDHDEGYALLKPCYLQCIAAN